MKYLGGYMRNKLYALFVCFTICITLLVACSSKENINADDGINMEQNAYVEQNVNTEQKTYIELDVKYSILDDGNAEVIGYEGNGNRATISMEYEGHPVVRISDSAFKGCKTLESVLFWASIEEIGESAFKDCSSLEAIQIPVETTIIKAHAFEGCYNLEELVIWGDSDIGDYAFAGCSKLTSISIGYDTSYVGNHAFDGCTSLTSVTVWNEETKFGQNVFANCPNLDEKPVEDTEQPLVAESETEEGTESQEENIGSQETENVVGKIVMPHSTSYYIGSEWTIETITEHFEKLGFTNIRAIPCDPSDDNYKVNIREMVIETGWFSTAPWEAGDEFDVDAEISIYYNEFPLLTVDNCPDLVSVLTGKNMSYMTFCEKYDGQYVEFEAHVVGHLTYDGGTSHVIDVAGGDYDGQTEIDAFDSSTYAGLIIRIGDRTESNSINENVEVGDNVLVSGRIDASWAEYYKCMYVETMELNIR